MSRLLFKILRKYLYIFQHKIEPTTMVGSIYSYIFSAACFRQTVHLGDAEDAEALRVAAQPAQTEIK